MPIGAVSHNSLSTILVSLERFHEKEILSMMAGIYVFTFSLIPPQGVRMQSVCTSSGAELCDGHHGAGTRVAFVVSPRRPGAVCQAPHLRLSGGGHRSGKRYQICYTTA